MAHATEYISYFLIFFVIAQTFLTGYVIILEQINWKHALYSIGQILLDAR